MDSELLTRAKNDIPLYFQDFKAFWDSTTVEYTDKELTNCYATSLIFKNWLICLNHIGINNFDELLSEINEDVNSSFFHSYFGHYRSSHMHLRSVIELSLQFIYFYQHEVEYQRWRKADFRIKHEELIKYLIKHPQLKVKTTKNLIGDISNNWRKYSKYIHAEAPKHFQTNLESVQTKQISKADFGIWKTDFLKTGYQINKLFLLFFEADINTFPSLNRELLLYNMKDKDLDELGIKS